MNKNLKCRWRNSGACSWHTTLDSDVDGVFIQLDLIDGKPGRVVDEKMPFAVIQTVPIPMDNKKVGAYPDLASAKKAAKQFYIDNIYNTPNYNEGAKRIVLEWHRQKTSEGYTAEHDDKHSVQELLDAAASYAVCIDKHASVPASWPWELSAWKPKERLRNLERAGALYLAAAAHEERQGGNGRVFRSAADGVAKMIDEFLAAAQPVAA